MKTLVPISRSCLLGLTAICFTSCTEPTPEEARLKKELTTLQYKVTMKGGTEPAFRNKYWNNKKEGIYVSIVSGEALFSSKDKFDSGTGWPSFSKPIEEGAVKVATDNSHGMSRDEVRSAEFDTHLGHVFNDGPEPTGLRYCMNSAAMKFVPVSELTEKGYGKYVELFHKD